MDHQLPLSCSSADNSNVLRVFFAVDSRLARTVHSTQSRLPIAKFCMSITQAVLCLGCTIRKA